MTALSFFHLQLFFWREKGIKDCVLVGGWTGMLHFIFSTIVCWTVNSYHKSIRKCRKIEVFFMEVEKKA